MTSRTLAFLLLLLTMARFGLAFQNHPTPSETYVWLKGQKPDWGYVEGPPGAPLLTRSLTDILGNDIGMALAGPLAALLASAGLWIFARRSTNDSIAAMAVVALNCLPIFNISAITTSSTGPALALGFLALAGFSAIIKQENTFAGWIWAGLMLGIGLYFEFVLLWLIPAFLLFLSLSKKARGEFFRPGLYTAIGILIIFALPLWTWNQTHDRIWWAGSTLRSTLSIPLTETRMLFANAFLGLSPLLACVLLLVAIVGLRQKTRRPFLGLALIPILGWLFTAPLSNGSKVLLLLAVAPLLCETGRLFIPTAQTSLRMTGAAALLLAILFTGASLFARRPVDEAAWRQTAERFQELTRQHADPRGLPAFLIASSPELAAALIYYSPNKITGLETWPPIFVRESAAMESQFSLWPRYEEFQKTDVAPDDNFTQMKSVNLFLRRDAFYITPESPDDIPTVIRSGFEAISPLDAIEFHRSGQIVRRLDIYLCSGYQTVPL